MRLLCWFGRHDYQMTRVKRGMWKTRKAKKRDLHRHRQFIKSEAGGMLKRPKMQLSTVGKSIRELALRMGKRGD